MVYSLLTHIKSSNFHCLNGFLSRNEPGIFSKLNHFNLRHLYFTNSKLKMQFLLHNFKETELKDRVPLFLPSSYHALM